MPVLTAADFDTANVILGISAAGGAILIVALTKYGWRSVIGFFGGR